MFIFIALIEGLVYKVQTQEEEKTMIIGHQVGDITSPANRRDIVIAMNTRLAEVTGIGRPFVNQKYLQDGALELGSVLTFRFDRDRKLHMLICHELGVGGWRFAPQYVRFGLDHLWFFGRDRRYSVVTIGEGPIGKRDCAPVAEIGAAIATSHLEVVQFSLGTERSMVAVALQRVVSEFENAWQPSSGYQPPIQVAA